MKLYTPPPPDQVLRVCIKKQGHKAQYLTICDCTQRELYNHVKNLIEAQKLSVFQTRRQTNVQIREAIGANNGKAISLTFKGLDPDKVSELIVESLTK
jgi:hypothetical protein